MNLALFFIIIGVLGLWWGSEIVVNAAQRIAHRLKISQLIIGLTVIAIGTSIPEIATNIASGISVSQGNPASGIAIGNIIGSSLANITLILGICGLFGIFYYKKIKMMRDGTVILGSIIIIFIVALDLVITKQEGIILMLVYLGYLLYMCMQEKVFIKTANSKNHHHTLFDIFISMLGIGIVIVSSYFVVNYGVNFAESLGIKTTLIGLFVGLGTSLPELTISLKALHSKAHGLSLGNLLGSNITTPLFSLGAGASVAGFVVLPQTLLVDIPFLLFGTLMALMFVFNKRLTKQEAAVLILFYCFFMYTQFFLF
ncbi:hypothetical protein COV16_00085 [Candidatus Woesearchaeota archaeon CG10_big_fil_rev_8_21_14_0_10_34_8]|nr:MAG: hypothetical protein COV16_00085 [Candidatus Woesearchaeota archaeon CG10_big_fil_rev_8_21_14_0_10_34_8]